MSKKTSRTSKTVPRFEGETTDDRRERGNYRNPELLAMVRELSCVHCGSYPVQAAHSNRLIHGKGRGIKASDAAIMALCSDEHNRIDNGTVYSKDDLQVLQDGYIIKTYIALWHAGKITIPHHIWQHEGNDKIALEMIAAMEAGTLINKL